MRFDSSSATPLHPRADCLSYPASPHFEILKYYLLITIYINYIMY